MILELRLHQAFSFFDGSKPRMGIEYHTTSNKAVEPRQPQPRAQNDLCTHPSSRPTRCLRRFKKRRTHKWARLQCPSTRQPFQTLFRHHCTRLLHSQNLPFTRAATAVPDSTRPHRRPPLQIRAHPCFGSAPQAVSRGWRGTGAFPEALSNSGGALAFTLTLRYPALVLHRTKAEG